MTQFSLSNRLPSYYATNFKAFLNSFTQKGPIFLSLIFALAGIVNLGKTGILYENGIQASALVESLTPNTLDRHALNALLGGTEMKYRFNDAGERIQQDYSYSAATSYLTVVPQQAASFPIIFLPSMPEYSLPKNMVALEFLWSLIWVSLGVGIFRLRL